MAVIHEVVESSLKLGVEVLNVGVLVDVQVQEMAKDVVVVLKLKLIELHIQSFHHLFGGKGYGRVWRAYFKNIKFDVVCDGKEEVKLHITILLHPCFPILQEAWLKIRWCGG
jgi:hypothetical protein